MRTVRPLRAVDTPSSKQAGQVRDADAVDLLGQNVVDSFLKVRDRVLESVGEAARDLAEEHARLRERIQRRTFGSAQMLAPSLSAAHASARASSISLARSGGVKTSSFDRLAMQVKR